MGFPFSKIETLQGQIFIILYNSAFDETLMCELLF